MKLKLATVALGAALAGIASAPKEAAACVADGSQTIGSVCVTAANFCPRGYAWMAGQLEAISDNQALYSLLGTTYGGDGRSSFGYPDMRGRTAVGIGQGIALNQVFLGQQRGQEGVALDVTQMPSHSHVATFTPTGSSQIDVNLYARNGPGIDPEPGPDVQLAVGNFKSGLSSTTVSNYGPPLVGPKVELGGLEVTSSGQFSGAVSVENTGGSRPVETLPPQLGLMWCIATTGLYPQRN